MNILAKNTFLFQQYDFKIFKKYFFPNFRIAVILEKSTCVEYHMALYNWQLFLKKSQKSTFNYNMNQENLDCFKIIDFFNSWLFD